MGVIKYKLSPGQDINESLVFKESNINPPLDGRNQI
jgi:hypothetical protein